MEQKMKKIRTKSQRGKWSRNKGHQFERDVAVFMRSVFPGARRHLEYNPLDATGVDIAHVGGYRIQCKRGRRYASITAIEQVNHDALMGDIPVLVTQGDGKPIMAVLPFFELLRLIRKTRPDDECLV